MSEHIAPRKMYFYVFFGLLILTLVTWQVAYIDLGKWNTVVMLIIAAGKATLVGTFFMHLRWSASMIRLVVFAAVFWLSILITLTIGDFFSRGNAEHQPMRTGTVISQSFSPAAKR
ncbi:MAG TPA: cytochrome C oxidase subunit IV family protein [Terriglobia bacterium]|nr:cytochrome C oxidase subunit IV family protein [Terriglobia bacterium]